MGAFEDSIKKNVEKILKDIDEKMYAITYHLFSSVVQNSPTKPFAKYAKGQFINNWFTAVNNYSNSTTSAINLTGMGSLSRITELKGKKIFYGKDGFVTFTNSLHYAVNVEYLGWNRTAPYAPVRTAFLKFSMENVPYDNSK